MTTAPASPVPVPPTGPAGRAVAAVVVGAVVVASVMAVVRFVVEAADVPPPADAAAAAAFLRERRLGEDDVVLVAPPWSLHALQQLGGDGVVGARLLPADGPWDSLHRGRHRRVFLWQEPDATPWLQGRDHRLVAAPPTQRHVFGVVSVVEVDDAPARFDLLRRFDDVAVGVEGGATCTERSRGIGGGLRCPGVARGVRVAREWAQVTEHGQPVVVVQPPAGRGLRLTVDGVTIADRLVVAAGHTRNALARLQEKQVQGGSVTIRVFVDDDVVGILIRQPAFRVEPQRRAQVARFVGARDPDGGFTAVVFDTRAMAGVNRRLSFIVSTDLADDSVLTGIGLDAFVPGD
jgi:hypothetical protein